MEVFSQAIQALLNQKRRINRRRNELNLYYPADTDTPTRLRGYMLSV